ncbi:MAG: penicillin-binding transpeptidase domain-containing protein [Candidatus Delongbacteria bacterium]|nr:penicillin-binding transpeptidase domain-containing protein [Candidatus Delongbacteria bacterium]MDD4204973.1 penicillin-binding transpeptidase domain-containing protein [Candidatus Delongbacteria bacterium]
MVRKGITVKNNGSDVERKHYSRLIFLFALSIIAYSTIALKLYDTQINRHDHYSKRYSEQSKKKITVYAPKGNIYDRKYSKLAENIGINYAFGVNTRVVKDKNSLAGRVSFVTGRDRKKYSEILKSKNGFVWVDNKLTEKEKVDIYSCLTNEEKSAASFKSTANRIYPQNRLAGQIIGYTDIDGKGLSGIEKEFEEELDGTDGWELVHQDGRLNKYYGAEISRKEPVPGKSIVLTIDDNYQRIAEDELAKAAEKWKAEKGTVIIMEPNSGEILAMASYPDFDPNKPSEYDPFNRKNKAVTDVYEPGSTFKGISAAILFEENMVDEEEVFFCSNEGYELGRFKIKDSHKNENEHMSFNDVIGQSSNVGTLQAMIRVEKDRHFEYLRDFGFGNKTEIELTGEVSGSLMKVRNWSKTTQPTLSFGQGITVTPLQLVTAYCAIANGGTLLKPMIVKGVIDKNNRIVKKNDTVPVRRVISEKASERVRNILRYAVVNGTGSNAEIDGLKVAGKTGTSQKVVDGKYSKTVYDASFIGMVPYDDPRLVCLVIINSPKGNYYGGTVSAPVFRNIISRIYDIDRSKLIVRNDKGSSAIEVPDLTGMKISEAEKLLKAGNIRYKISEGTEIVRSQSRHPFTVMNKNDIIVLYGEEVEPVRRNIMLEKPEVRNLSLREAVKLMYTSGIEPVVVGSGNVYRQSEIYENLDGTDRLCSLFCRNNFSVISKKGKKERL